MLQVFKRMGYGRMLCGQFPHCMFVIYESQLLVFVGCFSFSFFSLLILFLPDVGHFVAGVHLGPHRPT